MIVDRDLILRALRPAGAGLRPDEIVKSVQADAKGKHRVRALLAELVDEDVLEKAPGGRYRIKGWTPPASAKPAAKKGAPAGAVELAKGEVAGRLRVHPAGYGFVAREDGEDDVFIPARYRNLGLDGDRVVITTWLGYKGTEGRIERVLERGRAKLTGTVRGSGRNVHLEPDDPRIAATGGLVQLEGGADGAREGQAVVVEITRYPRAADEPLQAKITHVLGDPGDLKTEIEKIIICSDIPNQFPKEVEEAGVRAPTEVRPADLADRIDLRDRGFMTIDPETARDFDDAVCVEPSPKPGHLRLWVAVADVSHYVRPGHPLDDEAQVRGCSVYLPDRAIPMLPHQLSSHLASLLAHEDRLALVAEVHLDFEGKV